MSAKKCQHDINKENHTVRLSSRTFMITPETKIGVCSVCFDSLQFEKQEDGTWVIKKTS